MITLNNEFRVTLPVDETWELLTDLPRVARCLPGASLDDVVDGEYRGGISTKIGPISAKYRGSASFVERDDVGHRAIIAAKGREEKGSGSATANITAQLQADDAGTLVQVSTDLAISGRAAQFGRSLLAEVSSSMVAEFVKRLEAMIQGDDGSTTSNDGAARSQGAPASGPGSTAETRLTAVSDEPENLKVATMIALPMLRKAAVPIGAAAVSVLIGLLIGRRTATRSARGRGIPLTYVLPYPGAWTADDVFPRGSGT